MGNQMTLGSLFDGIAGFPLAAVRHGIKPIWGSEIETDCVDITAKNFPDMEQLGDITKLNGAGIQPVDIISFGSPCQNLSVAGNGKGLAGDASRLFYEAVRIIYEMRGATNGKYPKYIIWENVAGAFSSNKGQDFRRVLEEITKTSVPMPNSGRWAKAGLVRSGGVLQLGDSWTLNIGEYPSEEKESILYTVLEQNVPDRYYLSAKACWAMLQRAEDMERDMPDKLRIAFLEVIAEDWWRITADNLK
ncbi:DNA cytosine methyltransferase [Mediterraneibacter gnavus]|uniref:DNA cytosine methyltransferase n=1 Tax=Mediterraneibacter gnavus TaxID=33038 RepID=UPI003569ADD4